MTEKLILVEGHSDVEALKSTILSSPSTKIISFDFLAHKSLKELTIPHNLVEEYINTNDKSKIDNLAIELATSWYKQEDFSKFLEYNGLSLGSLLELEIPPYLFLHLKRMLGIIRIVEKETPRKIISSSLGDFVSAVCKDKKIETIANGNKITSTLYHDIVEIPMSIGGKMVSLKISKNHFLQIKRVLEIITNILFNLKPNLQKIANEKSILLLDFNPVLYPDLLSALSNSSQNIILLNQRRPAVWNWKSLQIVKGSKCKIVQLEEFASSDMKSRIDKERKDLQGRLNSLWSKQQILTNIFSVEGYSFWDAIKDNFVNITGKRFEESIIKFLMMQKLFENINVSCILEWAHVGVEEKIALFIANKRKIPSIFLQHGLFILNQKFEKYLSIFPLLPSNGAKEAVWGNIMKKYILEHKANQEDILLTGSPRHDIFFKQRGNTKNNDTILIASNGLFYLNFDGNDTRTYDYLENCIKKVLELVRKISNKKPVIKLHPAQTYYDIKPLIREIDPSIPIYQNQNIIDLIESCDVMISLSYSTALLDAMILGKPTMLVLIDDQKFEEEILVKRKATLCVSSIDDLESSLNDLLFNHSVREELIKNGKEFVNEYLTNQGTASERLVNILKNY